jgi:carboxymethylenebutenolidase
MYFGVASNDDAKQPEAKDTLREACASANVDADVEVYASLHGWCVTDMPKQNSVPIYNAADAEKAWSRLLALYKASLTQQRSHRRPLLY